MRLGDTIDITFTVYDDGELVDPSAMNVYVRDTLGIETQYEYPSDQIIRTGLGIFRLRFTIPSDGAIGTWTYRAVATADVTGSVVGAFAVIGLWS